MRCAFHNYELKFKSSSKRRNGTLVRFIFPGGMVGYADCHPWTEFGDLPLHLQKESLISQNYTPLATKTVLFGRLDAFARAQKKSLFENLKVPKSHYLIADASQFEKLDLKNFSAVKIKLKGQSAELKFLQFLADKFSHCKWRLDFNSQLNKEEFLRFLKSTKQWHALIDYCEDPFPYTSSSWKMVEEEYGISLAADFEFFKITREDYLPKVIVIKPAIQDLCSEDRRLIVTSYLDHPIGQLSAAYMAAKYMHSDEIAGLLSHSVYEENPFSRELSQGADLIPPSGTGFGFDNLLKKLKWQDA